MSPLAITLLFYIIIQISCEPETDSRIVGGRVASSHELPYQVSLRSTTTKSHFCGGTIITPKHVLTAAHCCYQPWGGVYPPFMLFVVAGQIPLQLTDTSIERNVLSLRIHPEYDRNFIENDIALLKLTENLPVDDEFIAVVALNIIPVIKQTPCTVSGWGVIKEGSSTPSKKLLITDVNILELSECQWRYDALNVTLTEGEICAVNDNKSADSCQGDSGGPLVCNGRLTGVISTGKGCGNREFPGIYTDVQFYYSWIKSEIGVVENKETGVFKEIWDMVFSSSTAMLKNLQGIAVFVFIWLIRLIIY